MGALALPLTIIQPSAEKGNSANFACWAFSEVAPLTCIPSYLQALAKQPICRDDDVGTRAHRVNQAEVRERAAIGEQAASFAEHQRVDLQYILVDQIAPHQRLD